MKKNGLHDLKKPHYDAPPHGKDGYNFFVSGRSAYHRVSPVN